MNRRTVLTCEANANPAPKYRWLQLKTSNTKEMESAVVPRGYEKTLVIENVNYEYQGQFVCEATNKIDGETRSVQSQPIKIEVTGAPQVQ